MQGGADAAADAAADTTAADVTTSATSHATAGADAPNTTSTDVGTHARIPHATDASHAAPGALSRAA